MDIEPLGDAAALVRIGASIGEEAERLVRAACARLRAAPIPGTCDLVPAYTTVALHYDPAVVGGEDAYATVAAALRERLAALTPADDGPLRSVEVHVLYGGEWGPDLEVVAANAGLSATEVVELHAAADYRVHMIGFAPGFPYLGGLDRRLACPRRAEPRTAVPAGSVGIGGAQTGIYPLESPGGWQIIGRTQLALFDAAREPAALLAPGDHVRFVPCHPGLVP